jgi:hypothetical protein
VFLARLPERRARLQLVCHEREDGRRRRAFEVGRHRLDVRRLPAALAPSVGLLRTVDVRDDDEPRVAEETPGVAEANRIVAGYVDGADVLDRLDVEVRSEARDRDVDLGPVTSGDEVDRLVGCVGDAPTLPLRLHGQAPPVGLDHDATVLIRAVCRKAG